MRVLVRAAFDTYSGYGRDGIDIARYLERAGVDVTPFPTSVMPGLPREFAELLTKDPTGPKDVALCFGPPFDLHPEDWASFAPVAVGWSMWERDKLERQDMADHGWDMRLRDRWWSRQGRDPKNGRRRSIDLMLVTCQMNAGAFSHLDPWTQYAVLPCGIDTDLWPAVKRDPSEQMVFGMCGMLNGRKDPFVMIDAWRELKEEVPEFDARLELKTMAPGLHPALQEIIPDLTIHDRAWPYEKLLAWYQSVDVMVTTSRGEGNNKPAMEHMATGGTSIAGHWGGHENWLDPDCNYAVGGTLEPVFPHDRKRQAKDFRIDKDALKHTILHCWSNRAEVVRKGDCASRFIRQSLSWENVVDRLVILLKEAVDG